ncbi:MAG: DUF2484 family protein [Pseudomonadota bacterium]
MGLSLFPVFGWFVAANVIGMFPSMYKHWPQTYVLVAVGVPILLWLFWADGLLLGLLVSAGARSILRWPLRFALRWVGRIFQGRWMSH